MKTSNKCPFSHTNRRSWVTKDSKFSLAPCSASSYAFPQSRASQLTWVAFVGWFGRDHIIKIHREPTISEPSRCMWPCLELWEGCHCLQMGHQMQGLRKTQGDNFLDFRKVWSVGVNTLLFHPQEKDDTDRSNYAAIVTSTKPRIRESMHLNITMFLTNNIPQDRLWGL